MYLFNQPLRNKLSRIEASQLSMSYNLRKAPKQQLEDR